MTTIYVSCYAIGKNSLNEFSENICDRRKKTVREWTPTQPRCNQSQPKDGDRQEG